jgi:BetI-type transcriptional repressor, C-terminal
MVDSELAALRNETYELLRQLFRTMMLRLVRAGLAPTGAARLYEAEVTYALVDGLIVHGILRPDLATPKETDGRVRRYVKSLRDRAA